MFVDAAQGSDEWVANRLSRSLAARNAGDGYYAGGYVDEKQRIASASRNVRLSDAVQRQGRPGLTLLDDYFRGEPPLPWCADGWRDGVLAYLRMSRLNVAELPIGSAVDCMLPLAWGTAVEDDADGDKVAHAVAAQNDLPLVVADVAQSMLTFGDGYAILGSAGAGVVPRITAEDARTCITYDDPVTGETRFGFKALVDEWTGEDAWYLYGPGWVRKSVVKNGGRTWLGEREPIPGHGAWCAVHRVKNRYGVGEFERHLDTIDRIIDGVFGRIVIAKYQAYRQRGMKGLPDTVIDPETNEEKKADYSGMFMADPGALWRIPEGVDVWESTPIDLGPIRLATVDDVKQFCALTRSPIYYMFPDEQQAAAGASNQAQSHDTRVIERRGRLEGFQGRLWAHTFEAMGDKARADVGRMRVEWSPIRRHSLSEQAQALPAFKAGGVPWAETMIRVLQVRPSEIDRLKEMRDEDALLAAANSLAAEPPPALVGAARDVQDVTVAERAGNAAPAA